MHKAPIQQSLLKKAGVLDDDQFFQSLSEEANYMDSKQAKEFYMALVRVLTKNLREKGVARMPFIGDYALRKQKPHIGWSGDHMEVLPAGYVLKYYPSPKWKNYFTEFTKGKNNCDPREKILGKKLGF